MKHTPRGRGGIKGETGRRVGACRRCREQTNSARASPRDGGREENEGGDPPSPPPTVITGAGVVRSVMEQSGVTRTTTPEKTIQSTGNARGALDIGAGAWGWGGK